MKLRNLLVLLCSAMMSIHVAAQYSGYVGGNWITLPAPTPPQGQIIDTQWGASSCILKAIAYKDGYETSNVLSRSYTIKSGPVPPTGIYVSPSCKTIRVGETFNCSYTLNPSNATTTVTWSSDDSSIASVNSYDKVSGRKVGTPFINAKTENGKTDRCKVTVKTAEPVFVGECVVVETSQGERMKYLLSDTPRITRTENMVTITTSKTKLELQVKDIAMVYLSATNSSEIRNISQTDGSLKWHGGCILLSGYQQGERVSLYCADGKLLWQKAIGEDGCLNVSLADQPSGIYIIKTNHQSVKISKK